MGRRGGGRGGGAVGERERGGRRCERAGSVPPTLPCVSLLDSQKAPAVRLRVHLSRETGRGILSRFPGVVLRSRAQRRRSPAGKRGPPQGRGRVGPPPPLPADRRGPRLPPLEKLLVRRERRGLGGTWRLSTRRRGRLGGRGTRAAAAGGGWRNKSSPAAVVAGWARLRPGDNGTSGTHAPATDNARRTSHRDGSLAVGCCWRRLQLLRNNNNE